MTIISLNLSEEAIKILDMLSILQGGNRSKFIDWLALNKFFVPTELVAKAEEINKDVAKLQGEVG